MLIKGYLSLYIWSSGVSVNVRILDPGKKNTLFSLIRTIYEKEEKQIALQLRQNADYSIKTADEDTYTLTELCHDLHIL